MDHDKKRCETHGEFDLITRYFHQIGKPAIGEVLLGMGDDAAMVSCAPNPIVMTVDTLVEGIHFYPDCPPDSIAHKALMVNLSDVAAMGATPFAFLLSLTLPRIDHPWLEAFSQALNTVATAHHVQLIGGDTTRGPLAVSITAMGNVTQAHVLKRSRARVDDDIYVTGDIGLAAFYVYARAQGIESSARAMHAYRYPNPPLMLGPKLCGLAHAAIDVSDGLLADLTHILNASNVGARLVSADIPIAKEWQALPHDEAFQRAVTGGDDYVLCFTAPKSARGLLDILSMTTERPMIRIGEICDGEGIVVDDVPWTAARGFEHF